MPIHLDTPLYKENQAQRNPPDNSHLGLWFTRFFNQYDEKWQVKKENHATNQKDGKKIWIKLTAQKECGDKKALANYKNRTLNLIKTLKNKQELTSEDFAICETNWNFVTGMGLPHPVENGMSWHHTLGVPYLAGSSMKGLLRAWVEGGWNEDLNEEQTKTRRRNWFGMVKGEDGDDRDQAGQLIFFDAVPIEQVKLIPDIMTPHYGQWYAEGGDINDIENQPERIPADWHDPVPIPFLAVKDAKFLVTVVVRDKKNDADAKEALQELIKALEWLGAGAKTAAGYGHLVRKPEEESDILEEFEEKELSGQRSDLENEFLKANQEQKMSVNWLDKMEAAEPEDAKKIAMQLKTFYEEIDKWKKTKSKQRDKVKRVKKILGE